MEEEGIDTYDLRNPDKKNSNRRNIEKEIEDLYAYPIQKNDMNTEMGIRPDGRVIGNPIQGLGAN